MTAATSTVQSAGVARALAQRARFAIVLLAISCSISACFGFFALQRVLQRETLPFVERLASPPPSKAAVPTFREVPDLLAVLVLDLSGSMKKSDPPHEQLRAVRTFLRTYVHMSRGVTSQKTPAQLAVVLYSSIAKVAAVDDDWWTPLRTEADVDVLATRLAPVLGEKQSAGEPRRGWNTDHLAAAQAVGRIVERYRERGHRGSVSVVFMTDGDYDPSPLADASLTEAELAENQRIFWEGVVHAAERRGSRNQAVELRDSFQKHVPHWDDPIDIASHARTNSLFPITDLRRQVSDQVFGGDTQWYKEITSSLHHGEGRDGAWFQAACGLAEGDLFRLVRLRADTAAANVPSKKDVVEIKEARQLEVSFAEILASWLRLTAEAPDDSGQVQVPPGARSLAIIARGSKDADPIVRCGEHRHVATGGVALIADPEPGACQIDFAGGVASIRAYTDSRYAWAIAVPRDFSLLDLAPPIQLALYRLDVSREEALTAPAHVYSTPLPSARCMATYPSGEQQSCKMEWSRAHRCYEGELPQPHESVPGAVTIRTGITGLHFKNGREAPPVEASASTMYREAVEIGMRYRPSSGEERAIAGINLLTLYRGAGSDTSRTETATKAE